MAAPRRSFRVRLMLLNAYLGLVVLLTFGLAAWWLQGISAMKNFDGQMAASARRLLLERPEQPPWERYRNYLRRLGAEERDPPPMLFVQAKEGRRHFVSDNWPAEIQPPAPDFPETPQSLPDAPSPTSSPRDLPAPKLNAPLFQSLGHDGHRWRLVTVAHDKMALTLGLPLDAFLAERRRLAANFLLALPPALLLMAGAALWTARRATRPAEKLANAIERIGVEGLDRRVALEGEDAEFARLIQLFNLMMDRLERSFHQAGRFSADAAHELNTPLSVLQARIEENLRKCRSGSSSERAFAELLEELHQLKSLVQKLLLLSRADAGRLAIQPEHFDLAPLLLEIAEDCQALAPDLEIRHEAPSTLPLRADRALLAQVLRNLADNAAKYNRPGGEVRFLLSQENTEALLIVENTGPLIPESEGQAIFTRFYRIDAARERATGGSGLGLSLAREIAQAHGGSLELLPPRDQRNRLALRLPLQARETSTF